MLLSTREFAMDAFLLFMFYIMGLAIYVSLYNIMLVPLYLLILPLFGPVVLTLCLIQSVLVGNFAATRGVRRHCDQWITSIVRTTLSKNNIEVYYPNDEHEHHHLENRYTMRRFRLNMKVIATSINTDFGSFILSVFERAFVNAAMVLVSLIPFAGIFILYTFDSPSKGFGYQSYTLRYFLSWDCAKINNDYYHHLGLWALFGSVASVYEFIPGVAGVTLTCNIIGTVLWQIKVGLIKPEDIPVQSVTQTPHSSRGHQFTQEQVADNGTNDGISPNQQPRFASRKPKGKVTDVSEDPQMPDSNKAEVRSIGNTKLKEIQEETPSEQVSNSDTPEPMRRQRRFSYSNQNDSRSNNTSAGNESEHSARIDAQVMASGNARYAMMTNSAWHPYHSVPGLQNTNIRRNSES